MDSLTVKVSELFMAWGGGHHSYTFHCTICFHLTSLMWGNDKSQYVKDVRKHCCSTVDSQPSCTFAVECCVRFTLHLSRHLHDAFILRLVRITNHKDEQLVPHVMLRCIHVLSEVISREAGGQFVNWHFPNTRHLFLRECFPAMYCEATTLS